MIEKIRMLISELEDEALQANSVYYQSLKSENVYGAYYSKGVEKACIAHVSKLTLLLNSENEKSSQISQGDGSNSSNAM